MGTAAARALAPDGCPATGYRAAQADPTRAGSPSDLDFYLGCPRKSLSWRTGGSSRVREGRPVGSAAVSDLTASAAPAAVE